MNSRKNGLASSFNLAQAGVLHRACACGQHTIVGNECAECRQKREGMMQRAAVSAAPTNSVPPIVHDVLNSSGQPLDSGTRAFMEPRFEHDFSQVRVHTDARAAESARAVNALAYTVGRDVVFGRGQYAPTTIAGKKLMAHELTHVIQQQGTSFGKYMNCKLDVSEPDDPGEREAEQVAHRVMSNTSQFVGSFIPTLPTVQRLSASSCATGSKCDSPDAVGSGSTASSWQLVLAVDKEKEGLGRLISGDVGHTWVKLNDDIGTKYSYGFWPQIGYNSKKPYEAVAGCVHHPDTAHEPPRATNYIEIGYDLSQKGFMNGLNYAQNICKSRPNYSLFSFNCTTFAVEMAKAAGVSPPSSATLAIDNPNALYEGIEEDLADRAATAAAAPLGESGDAGVSLPGGVSP